MVPRSQVPRQVILVSHFQQHLKLESSFWVVRYGKRCGLSMREVGVADKIRNPLGQLLGKDQRVWTKVYVVSRLLVILVCVVAIWCKPNHQSRIHSLVYADLHKPSFSVGLPMSSVAILRVAGHSYLMWYLILDLSLFLECMIVMLVAARCIRLQKGYLNGSLITCIITELSPC